MKQRHDELREQFYKTTGEHSFRTQFDAHIKYVVWLEAKIIDSQPDVSGNEGNQLSSDKKVAEVAVAFAEWIDINNYATGTLVTKELYERFKKKAKATDR